MGSSYPYAEVAHLVEHDLAKVGVAGSSPVFRSKNRFQIAQAVWNFCLWSTRVVESVDTRDLKSRVKTLIFCNAPMVELVDTRDLKSLPQQWGCRFNSCSGHSTKQF